MLQVLCEKSESLAFHDVHVDDLAEQISVKANAGRPTFIGVSSPTAEDSEALRPKAVASLRRARKPHAEESPDAGDSKREARQAWWTYLGFGIARQKVLSASVHSAGGSELRHPLRNVSNACDERVDKRLCRNVHDNNKCYQDSGCAPPPCCRRRPFLSGVCGLTVHSKANGLRKGKGRGELLFRRVRLLALTHV